jgi:hypothetical protein
MFKRLLITALAALIFGGALVTCGDSGAGSEGKLEWRSAVDVPVNFELPVNFEPLFPGCKDLDPNSLTLLGIDDCNHLTAEQKEAVQLLLDNVVAQLPDTFFINLGTPGSVPTTSDVMDFLRKLTHPEIRYSIGIKKSTDVKFTVYGMFFPPDDSLANLTKVDSAEFYDIVVNDHINGKRVNVLDAIGIDIDGSERCYPHGGPCGKLTDPNSILNDLVIGRGKNKKSFSYRWLLKLEKSEYEKLRKKEITNDIVRIRIRMRFSGVNSMDSLFTL